MKIQANRERDGVSVSVTIDIAEWANPKDVEEAIVLASFDITDQLYDERK